MTQSVKLGVDIGGTKTLVGVLTNDGTLIDSRTAPTPTKLGGGAVVASVVDLARRVLENRVPSSIGIGAAGVIDSPSGKVLASTDSIAGWVGTDILGPMAAAFPGVPATVVNDVHAFVVGELAHGAARGAGSLFGITVGTGIGGALIVDQKLVHGAHSAAGHLGHVLAQGAEMLTCPCGRIGHLEAVASGPAMTAACRRAGLEVDDLTQVAALADDGDPIASAVLDGGARSLGLVIGSLINVFDPELVVVGGGVAQLGARWITLVSDAAQSTTIPAVGTVRVVRAELGHTAVAVGAAVIADRYRATLPSAPAEVPVRTR